jgi:hypothetical protein
MHKVVHPGKRNRQWRLFIATTGEGRFIYLFQGKGDMRAGEPGVLQ